MWIDGSANVTRTLKVNGKDTIVDYTTTLAGVQEIVRRCKLAHVNTLVVDIKPLSGQVLYASKVAPRMRMWKGRPVPDFDVLAAFVAEGHKAGLQVDACINTLSEGHKLFGVGLAYQHPDWQSVVLTVDRGVSTPGGARLPIRVAGEPDDARKPALLAEGRTLVGGDPNSGLIGLEAVETGPASVQGDAGAKVGQQVNLVLDDSDRAVGVIDNALLGDDPLVPPDGGRLVTATRPEDRAWLGKNIRPGTPIRYDLQTHFTPITQAASEKVSCFVNPLHPDVRKHILDVVREITTNYAIDGLVLDRCRHSNLYNDFSDLSRHEFERHIGHPVAHWPADIFQFAPTPGDERVIGPLFKPWLEFRAQNIRDLAGEIARTARQCRPGIIMGTYVGSWYPSYYEVGVNWGSDKTGVRYSWFTPDYPRTGYAEFFDWISTGCYYPIATRFEARQAGRSEKGTVEYAAELSQMAVANGAWVYPGIYVPDFAGKPDAMIRALEACARQGQGWMIFDISYIDQFNWWPYLERGFAKDTPTPDRQPELLSSVRSAMDAAE